MTQGEGCLRYARRYGDPSVLPIIDALIARPEVTSKIEYAEIDSSVHRFLYLAEPTLPVLTIWAGSGGFLMCDTPERTEQYHFADVDAVIKAVERWAGLDVGLSRKQ